MQRGIETIKVRSNNDIAAQARWHRGWLVLLGSLVLISTVSFAYYQSSFNNYTEHAARTGVWNQRIDQTLSFRGKAFGIVRSLLKPSEPAKVSSSVDALVLELQSGWGEFRNDSGDDDEWKSILDHSGQTVDTEVNRLALTSLRAAIALRRNDQTEVQRLVSEIQQVDMELSDTLTTMEEQISQFRIRSEVDQLNALIALNRAQRIMLITFLALVFCSSTGLLLTGMQWFRTRGDRKAVEAPSTLQGNPVLLETKRS